MKFLVVWMVAACLAVFAGFMSGLLAPVWAIGFSAGSFFSLLYFFLLSREVQRLSTCASPFARGTVLRVLAWTLFLVVLLSLSAKLLWGALLAHGWFLAGLTQLCYRRKGDDTL